MGKSVQRIIATIVAPTSKRSVLKNIKMIVKLNTDRSASKNTRTSVKLNMIRNVLKNIGTLAKLIILMNAVLNMCNNVQLSTLKNAALRMSRSVRVYQSVELSTTRFALQSMMNSVNKLTKLLLTNGRGLQNMNLVMQSMNLKTMNMSKSMNLIMKPTMSMYTMSILQRVRMNNQ